MNLALMAPGATKIRSAVQDFITLKLMPYVEAKKKEQKEEAEKPRRVMVITWKDKE